MALYIDRRKMSKPPHRSVVGETKAIFYIKEIPILVDREDLWFILRHRWSMHGRAGGTAIRSGINNRDVSLAQFLMEDLSTKFDHKNRNFRDNKKVNLRPATLNQNAMNKARRKDNSSGYRGVSWHKRIKKWQAQIGVDGTNICLGYFKDKMDAVQAFNEAVIKYHREFAVES